MKYMALVCTILVMFMNACSTEFIPKKIDGVGLQFNEDGSLLSASSLSIESGHQLFFGERHNKLTKTTVETGIKKDTIGILGGTIGGALVGSAVGNPVAGAAGGALAGGLNRTLDKDDDTSKT
jgi:hypothetical protein